MNVFLTIPPPLLLFLLFSSLLCCYLGKQLLCIVQSCKPRKHCFGKIRFLTFKWVVSIVYNWASSGWYPLFSTERPGFNSKVTQFEFIRDNVVLGWVSLLHIGFSLSDHHQCFTLVCYERPVQYAYLRLQ